MDALHVGDVGAKAGIFETSTLTEGLGLEVRAEIVKRIAARIVVILIFPQEAAKCEHGICTDHAGPGWRDVERLNLRALISRSQRCACERVIENKGQAEDRIGMIFLIV